MEFYLMQVNFSDEIFIVNEFRKYLQSNDWNIIQLVCSGGQAHMSISFKIQGRNKTVFPDVIALRDNLILIGEVKSRYDYNDEQKILEIMNSELAQSRLMKNISIRFDMNEMDLCIMYALINSEVDSVESSCLYQFVFDGEHFLLKPPTSSIIDGFPTTYI